MTGPADSFRLDLPRANDIVGEPMLIAGTGGGFEATIDIRLLANDGRVIVQTSAQAANLTSPWQATVSVPQPPSPWGVLQVGSSTGADEATPMISVPIAFGKALVPDYRSYFLYTVQPGDTLSSIASQQAPLYVGQGFEPIFEANRHVIGSNPNRIHPGTVLRLPSNF